MSLNFFNVADALQVWDNVKDSVKASIAVTKNQDRNSLDYSFITPTLLGNYPSPSPSHSQQITLPLHHLTPSYSRIHSARKVCRAEDRGAAGGAAGCAGHYMEPEVCISSSHCVYATLILFYSSSLCSILLLFYHLFSSRPSLSGI